MDSVSDKFFLEARDMFLQKLPHPERLIFANCKGPEELLADVRKLGHFRTKNQAWIRILEKIKSFSDNIEPYFKIVEVVISSHPESAAIAWGAIRLVLQLASNFSVFFTKLADVLEEMGRSLPRYKIILDTVPPDISDRFKFSLTQLYGDLFEFFAAICGVFTQKNGKVKKTPIVIAELLWKPFHVRYGHLLEKLRFHRVTLSEELDTIQTRIVSKLGESHDAEKALAEEYRKKGEVSFEHLKHVKDSITAEQLKAESRRILDWLHPLAPDDVQEPYWQARGQRAANTNDWIFDNPNFLEWEQSTAIMDAGQHANLLWIKGNPGAGKSVLASSVLDYFQSKVLAPAQPNATECTREVCCHFFFSYRLRETRRSLNAYREILSQIFSHFRQDPKIFDCFSFLQSGSASRTAGTPELAALLSVCVRHIPLLTILCDGVDECDEAEDFIKSLLSAVYGTSTKIIIFSRPNLNAVWRATCSKHITLTRETLDNDIRTYLCSRLCELVADEKLPRDCAQDAVLNHLLDSANGMFLWARLMIEYLESPAFDRPASRMAIIWETTKHESLDDMYVRILRYICTKIKPERDLARRTLMWLTHQKEPLDARGLWEIIYRLRDPLTSDTPNVLETASQTDLEQFESAIVIICASLVESGRDHYRLIHQSVAEFLTSWPVTLEDRYPEISELLIQPDDAHNLLVQECFTYMTVRVPAQPLSGDMRIRAVAKKIHHAFPFASYCSLHWPWHLNMGLRDRTKRGAKIVLTKQVKTTMQSLSLFMANKVAINTWIELHYTFRPHEDIEDDLRYLDEWCKRLKRCRKNSFPEDLDDFPQLASMLYADMISLHHHWGRTLESNPYYIWNDVTAFENGDSFAKSSALDTYTLVPGSSGEPNLCRLPLVTLSRNGRDDSQLAILNIFPPKASNNVENRQTEYFWSKPAKDNVNMRNILCEGWVATFEIFQLQPGGGKETVRKLRIPLDHTQIKEHVQRSLCVRRSKISNSAQWSLPFPAAIGSGLDFVLVLESCYRITNSSEPSIIQLGSPAFTTPLPCHTSMQEELVARSYNYQLSDNGCYILRQEFNTMVRMEVGDPTIHSLCVLGFDSNTQSYRSYRIRGLEENLKLIKSSGIHPSLPLLLCLVRRSPIACEGMLMSFVADDADNAAIRPQTHDTLGSCSICPPREGVEYMQFSACGKNIVVKNVGNPHPAIYPLSQNTVYQSVLQREEARDQSAAWPGMDSIISHNTQNTNALIFGRPKLEIGKPTLTSSSATTDLGLSGWTTRRDVQIITTDEETTTTQHLVSLPDSWTDIGRSTDVSVTESNDGQVRIILNQGTKTWYNGPDALHRNLPVVIEKDVQALLPSRKIDTVGLLSAYEGDSDEEEEEEQEEDTFRKRRRLIGHA